MTSYDLILKYDLIYFSCARVMAQTSFELGMGPVLHFGLVGPIWALCPFGSLSCVSNVMEALGPCGCWALGPFGPAHFHLNDLSEFTLIEKHPN